MFREILPNLVAPIVVYTTLVIPQNILLEAALSYLGVGINPPQASWGEMLAEATPIFATAWWFFLFPGPRSCSPCSPSTCSATGSATPSTRRRAMTMSHTLEGGSNDGSTQRGSRRPLAVAAVAAAALLRGGVVGAVGRQRSHSAGRRRQAGGTITVLSAGDVDHIDPGQAYYSFTYEISYATQRPLLVVSGRTASTAIPDLASAMPTYSKAARRSPCTSGRASASARPSTAR